MQNITIARPYLRACTASAFTTFRDDFNAYSAQHPDDDQLNAYQLISASVLRLINRRVANAVDLDNDDLLTSINHAFFSPRSNVEALSRLRALSFPHYRGQAPSIELLMRHIQSFEDLLDSLDDDTRPNARLCRKAFVSSLPALLQTRVELTDPRSFDDAVTSAMDELDQVLNFISTLNLPAATTTTTASTAQQSSTTARVSQSSTNQSSTTGDLVCHGCGNTGHIRPNCPMKDHADFFKTGRRRVAIKSETKVASAGSDDLPRRAATIAVVDQATTAFEVMTLLDSGSSLNLCSAATARRLKEAGAETIPANISIDTANGPAMADVAIMTTVTMDNVTFDATIYELDCGEDLLLSYPTIRNVGLVIDPGLEPTPSPDELSPVTPLESDPTYAETNVPTSVAAVIAKHPKVFSDAPFPGGADVPPMDIVPLPDAVPSAEPPRRQSPAMRTEIDKQVQTLLDSGIITPSSSPWAAPVFTVPKKGGKRRMVVDYRELNKRIKDLKFPLSNPEELMTRLAGYTHFAALDLVSGYHQVPLTPAARELTAFATPNGLYEFTRVPFGVKTAPSAFQRMMTEVFRGLVGDVCEVFVDDIVVKGRSVEDLTVNLDKVLTRLHRHHLTVNPDKTTPCAQEVEYLGHIVSGTGVRMSASRTQAILDMAAPSDLSTTRAFCGAVNYFRRFIPDLSSAMGPLYELTSGAKHWAWTDEAAKAFTAVKALVAAAPKLAFLDYTQPVIVRTDASDVGCGGMLLNVIDGEEHVVEYCSHVFSPAERRWATIEQEAFAIYFAVVTKFSPHLLGHKFVVETDHKNLTYMQSSVTPKVLRWSLRMQEYDFTVKHIPGTSNVVPDALSRCMRVTNNTATLAQSAVACIHNATAGHMGIKETLRRLRDMGLTWPTMSEDVSKYISACPTCQKTRGLHASTVESDLRPTMTHKPGECWAFDTVGPFPEDDMGNKYVITFIDTFTRFVELIPTRSASAKDACRALLQVLGRYGTPKAVRSDKGSQYMANMFQQLLQVMDLAHVTSLPYHPRANGLVERANAELGRHLSALTLDKRVTKTAWSSALPIVQRIMNTTPCRTTNIAPARIMFGDAASCAHVFNPNKPLEEGMDSYVQQLVAAQATLIAAADKAQDSILAARNTKDIQPLADGSFVVVSRPGRKPDKLTPKLMGPYEVVSHAHDIYKVKTPTSGVIQQPH